MVKKAPPKSTSQITPGTMPEARQVWRDVPGQLSSAGGSPQQAPSRGEWEHCQNGRVEIVQCMSCVCLRHPAPLLAIPG